MTVSMRTMRSETENKNPAASCATRRSSGRWGGDFVGEQGEPEISDSSGGEEARTRRCHMLRVCSRLSFRPRDERIRWMRIDKHKRRADRRDSARSAFSEILGSNEQLREGIY